MKLSFTDVPDFDIKSLYAQLTNLHSATEKYQKSGAKVLFLVMFRSRDFQNALSYHCNKHHGSVMIYTAYDLFVGRWLVLYGR